MYFIFKNTHISKPVYTYQSMLYPRSKFVANFQKKRKPEITTTENLNTLLMTKARSS